MAQRRFLRALRELLEEGEAYATLNTSDIAARAGVSRTAFYRDFHDKPSALQALAREAFDDLERRLETLGADDPDRLIDALLDGAKANGPVLCAVLQASHGHPELSALRRRRQARLARVLAQAITGDEPEAVATVLLLHVQACVCDVLEHPGPVERALRRLWADAMRPVPVAA